MCEGLTLTIKHSDKGYIQMSNRPLSEMSGSKASWNKQSITAHSLEMNSSVCLSPYIPM